MQEIHGNNNVTKFTTTMKQESNIQNTIRLNVPKNARLFRNNVVRGYQGKAKRHTDGTTVTIEHARIIDAGLCKGSSDLIGFTSIEITPDMVGQKIAVFTAVEVKTKTGKPSTEQLNFIKLIRTFGGRAGIARNIEDAQKIINGE